MYDLRNKYTWGTYLWGYIHTITIIDCMNPDHYTNMVINLLKNIKNVIYCQGCVPIYEQYLEKLDGLDKNEPMVLFRWSVELHNEVNRKLNKPEMTYDEAVAQWCNKTI